jgi:hypothetical protein
VKPLPLNYEMEMANFNFQDQIFISNQDSIKNIFNNKIAVDNYIIGIPHTMLLLRKKELLNKENWEFIGFWSLNDNYSTIRIYAKRKQYNLFIRNKIVVFALTGNLLFIRYLAHENQDAYKDVYVLEKLNERQK